MTGTTVLGDQLALRDLVARYADAVNRRDADALAAFWVEEGTWTVPGVGTVTGRADIASTLRTMQGRYEFIVQSVGSGYVDIDGDRATGRWYVEEFGRLTSGDGSHLIGRYDDVLVRTDEGWRFVSRTFSLIYLGKPDVRGRHYPMPTSS